MLALSRDDDLVFLHEPRERIAVPILLELDSGACTIVAPQAEILANDFRVYESLSDLKNAVRSDSAKVDRAVRLSRFYTDMFAADFAPGSPTTLRQLRTRIEAHYHHDTAAVDRLIGNSGADGDLYLLSAGVRQTAPGSLLATG